MTETWIDRFPGLSQLPTDIRVRLLSEIRVVNLSEGTRIFGPGQAPAHFLLLLHGTIRVQQMSEGGREIVLYRIHAGESCALTTACLLGDEDYQAEGIADTAIEALAIPRATFDDLIVRSDIFRRYVFSAFGARITDLFRVIDEIAFSRVDVRLAHKLLEMKDAQGDVPATHQELASELGTAREVVSRHIQEFQRRGWLRTARGMTTITQIDALIAFADPARRETRV